MAKVEDQWQSYRQSCYGAGPTNPVQERECRQAFISGMMVALGIQDQFARLPNQDEAVRLIGELHDDVLSELMAYAQAGMKGQAS